MTEEYEGPYNRRNGQKRPCYDRRPQHHRLAVCGHARGNQNHCDRGQAQDAAAREREQQRDDPHHQGEALELVAQREVAKTLRSSRCRSSGCAEWRAHGADKGSGRTDTLQFREEI